MDTKEILSHVDHTLLSTTATWDDIRKIVDDGIKYGCASVCIPQCYVKQAADYADGKVRICTVIGFPNGYNESAVKGIEASTAVAYGADEVDMVINVGKLKAGLLEDVLADIEIVTMMAKADREDVIVKVIVESADLTEDELEHACELVERSRADYIKTSTGFSKNGGATFDAVETMVRMCPSKKVKAAGGISSLEDAERFLEIGADRLGTSRVVKLVKEGE